MGALRITEIFHSIQGESSRIGVPCVFVRLTGCPLRCVWCDTAYAFQGGRTMTEDEVVEAVRDFGCPLVEVTGGEPLSQTECPSLLRRLADEGFEVLLETSGAVSIEPVDARVKIVLDLKCPDSGESARNHWDNLSLVKPEDEIKFVIASRRDYEWARETCREHQLAAHHEVLFSPVWDALEFSELASWILADRLAVRMQVQLHKIVYGPEETGV